MAKKKTKRDELSEVSVLIETFLNTVDQLSREYNWCEDKLVELDKLNQDYLHKLELENIGYEGRAKVATQIMHCRRERRECKDTIMVLKPLYDYVNSEKGKSALNQIRAVLGQVRTAEKRMRDQTYIPRVLKD